ncbi:MAG: methylenetetrahydrofolate--tRNA-(uracil(54)-C(5))-methyltransferase (FADH(2)-oxidizing) TrmFO [Oscillospiraceae bacterium]|nr:methylenetetrahydrofolate--tRNA-(uracil(54)-C(5))-methyltransferase (FADH(2)-oxidizing) TrmFO [Oscillospiraceae bacterium]
MSKTVKVIGAGLAGCEAAWQLAEKGISVELYEMKPEFKSLAHVSNDFAELVCSNSFRGNDLANAVGLLKEEMRRLGSLIIQAADKTKIPAGGALAVDRELFARYVTKKVKSHPLINVIEENVSCIPEGNVVIATGPLTSDNLIEKIIELMPEKEMLNFYDSAAPIVTVESIDMNNSYFASRYDKGDADYINCPLDKESYLAFHKALISAETAPVHGFEDKFVFEGCIPIEVMAKRGEDTIRYGPLKPIGLRDPVTGKEPYAVVQLRKDNAEGSLYNIVGFQTHLKFGEQKRVLGMIPALKNADIVRFGVMHKNTYIDSPKLLDRYYRLKHLERIRFAGQITGVEGYVESAASGLLTGLELSQELHGLSPFDFPQETAIGALALYVSEGSIANFQPMNINFGIIAPLGYKVKGKREKNLAISERALGILDSYVDGMEIIIPRHCEPSADGVAIHIVKI